MADKTKKNPAPKKEKEGNPDVVDKAAAKGTGEGGAPAPKGPKKAPAPAAAGEAAAGGAAVAEAPQPGEPAAAAAAPTAAELLADDLAGKKIVKAKGAKNVTVGVANILATFNNTLVSITDMQGHVIGWSEAGRAGFKGSPKNTASAP